MRVLVTGASGTIGTVLMSRLAKRASIVALDTVPPKVEHEAINYVSGNVEDNELVARLVKDVTHVIHLARDNPSSWDALHRVDIQGTRNVMQAAADSGTQRFIFASSTHPMGQLEHELLHGTRKEIDPTEAYGEYRPDSEYAVAKAFGETYARYLAETAGLHVSCLRIGTMRPVDDIERYLDEPGFAHIPNGREGVRRRLQGTWLLHDDLWTILLEELSASEPFRLRYAVSDSPARFWPLDVRTWTSPAKRGEALPN